MKITSIQCSNIKSFKELPKTELSKNINILVGPNNGGKSTILKSIYLLQSRDEMCMNDITHGQINGEIELNYEGEHLPIIPNSNEVIKLLFQLRSGEKNIYYKDGNKISFHQIASQEPDNLIYPYFSKRKVHKYTTQISETSANAVTGTLQDLYSKIDRLSNPNYDPVHKQYVNACENIIGFFIGTLQRGEGKIVVYTIHNSEHIPLTSMGEGLPSILGLIVDLCVAENKIFLIEELENDIHPKALKALLNLIIEKSDNNQFFISTHSNIVMKQLGAVTGAKIFKITSERDDLEPKLYISNLKEISTLEERRLALEELGYDFFDFDLWKGWLLLEESSAEILIREHFIEWYVPSLKNKLRTHSSRTKDKIKDSFDNLNNLFVFLHLEPIYKNKAWVIIDGGNEEQKLIDGLKNTYTKHGWSEDNFSQFSEHDFEKYYPPQFTKKVNTILNLENHKKKYIQKKELLTEVKQWIADNNDLAKTEFEKSAKEVIDKLKTIEKVLT